MIHFVDDGIWLGFLFGAHFQQSEKRVEGYWVRCINFAKTNGADFFTVLTIFTICG